MNTFEWLSNYFSHTEVYKIIIDFIILSSVLFLVYLVFKASKKTFSYLFLVIVILLINYLVQLLELPIALQIFNLMSPYFAVIVILLFFNEIRLILEGFELRRKARSHEILGGLFVKTIMNTVEELAKNKVGALITIQNAQSLDEYVQKAIQMDAIMSQELLLSIFNIQSPTHDGAVIIQGDRIACCGAYYPMTFSDQVSKSMGSRHRAALGISEVYDCLTIVVSEESGRISITHQGVMERNIGKEGLQSFLNQYVEN